MSAPYYEDAAVTLYLGEFQDHLERLVGDAVVTDPPYGETPLHWDQWPDGWPTMLESAAPALWCFGSLRMFLDRREDFWPWKFSHEIVWEKHNGSWFSSDKFRRVHELATFWYRGAWADLRHEVPRVSSGASNRGQVHRGRPGEHTGKIKDVAWTDDGTRLQKSVIQLASMQGSAVHPTQKPLGIVSPLIEYSVPIGGMVVDPFAGSGTTLLAAKLTGRRAVGVEVNEAYCEAAAIRLSQQSFDLEAIS